MNGKKLWTFIGLMAATTFFGGCAATSQSLKEKTPVAQKVVQTSKPVVVTRTYSLPRTWDDMEKEFPEYMFYEADKADFVPSDTLKTTTEYEAEIKNLKKERFYSSKKRYGILYYFEYDGKKFSKNGLEESIKSFDNKLASLDSMEKPDTTIVHSLLKWELICDWDVGFSWRGVEYVTADDGTEYWLTKVTEDIDPNEALSEWGKPRPVSHILIEHKKDGTQIAYSDSYCGNNGLGDLTKSEIPPNGVSCWRINCWRSWPLDDLEKDCIRILNPGKIHEETVIYPDELSAEERVVLNQAYWNACRDALKAIFKEQKKVYQNLLTELNGSLIEAESELRSINTSLYQAECDLEASKKAAIDYIIKER